MNRLYKRLLLFLAVVIGIIALYYFGFSRFFSLETLKKHEAALKLFVERHYLFSVILYMLSLTITVLFALPIVALFALAGGYLFGVAFGLLYAEIAATFGAVASFIVYRYFLYNIVHAKYHKKLDALEKEVKKDGASYLLMLQFSGVVPFFIINIVAILADIPFKTVLWTTAVGAFPFLLVYVIAGSQLSSINSLQDLMSMRMIGLFMLFVVLSLIPIVIKKFKKNNGSLPLE